MEADITFARRSQLLRDYQVPMVQEANEFLGELLTDVIMHTMTPRAQELMGVSKPLSTPPKYAMIKPQDKLDGKICVRPPPVVECLQAFTHEKIMEMGAEIEQRMMAERAALIEEAIKNTEEFEHFECAQRVKFAVKQEHESQLIERKWERNELLTMFQEEREQLLETHSAAMEALTQSLNLQCKMESEKRIAEEIAKAEAKSLELEMKWKVEEALMYAFLNSANERLDNIVQEIHADYMKIFKKLYESFLTELQEQRNQMYCSHIAEMMHVVSVEKKITDSLLANQNLDFQQTLDALQAQVTELEQNPSKESIKSTSPQTKKLEILFTNVLKQYSDFVEYILNAQPGQGNFLVPTQRYLRQVLADESNVTTVLECFLSKKREMPTTSNTPVCYDSKFLPVDPFAAEIAPTMVLAGCEIKPKPREVVSKDSTTGTDVSSSLSCFDYKGQIYASNKHFDEIVAGAQNECDNIPEFKWKDEKGSVNFDDSEGNSAKDDQLEDKINDFCRDLAGALHDPHMDASARADRDTLIKTQVSNFARNLYHEMSKVSSFKSISSPMSKFLSTADSLELVSSVRQSMVQDTERPPLEQPVNSLASIHDKQAQCSQQSLLSKKSKKTPASNRQCSFTDGSKSRGIQLSTDEYVRSKRVSPSYMRSSNMTLRKPQVSLWDYQVTTEDEWQTILDKVTEEARCEKRVFMSDLVNSESIKSENSLPKMKTIMRNRDPQLVNVSEVSSKVSNLSDRMTRDAEISELLNRRYRE